MIMMIVAIVFTIIVINYFILFIMAFHFNKNVVVLEGSQLSSPTKNHLFFLQKKRKKYFP